MAQDLDYTRQKLDTTNTVTEPLQAGTVTESGDTSKVTYFLPINSDIDPPTFDKISSTNTDTSLVADTPGDFADVEEGDGVSGAGIQGGTTVQTKTDDTNLVLSLATTATASGVNVTFDPPQINPTILGLEVVCTPSGGNLNVTVNFHEYNGSLQGTLGTAVNSSAKAALGSKIINMDSVMSVLRLFRTNT